MRTLVLSALAAFTFAPVAQADVYKMDPGHTEVRFYWNHAGLTDQSGEWGVVGGSIDFDPEDLEATKATIEIEASSIDTGVEGLDKHLKSDEFFDAEAFPKITFRTTSVKQTGANSLRLIGDLTVKDQTKPLSIDVDLTFQGEHPLGGFFDYYKGDWIGVQASGSLLRSDYGVGKFAPLTGDNIRLEIATEMRKGGWE